MYIYKILNKVNGKFYIGSTKNFKRRKGDHIWALNKNEHYNILLQRSWNKYGSDAFIFLIHEQYENISRYQLLQIEFEMIKKIKPPYNLCKDIRYIATKKGRKSQADKESMDYIVKYKEEPEFSIRNLRKFCRERNLCQSGMFRVCSGSLRQYKGWKIRYKEEREFRYKEKNTYKITLDNGTEYITNNLKKFFRENRKIVKICYATAINILYNRTVNKSKIYIEKVL